MMSKGVKYTNKKVAEISKLHFYLSQYKHIRTVLTMITFKDHKKFSSSNKCLFSWNTEQDTHV